MDSQENQDEIQANWYFRSDDKPMENIDINEKWTLYTDSEEIEGNFQQYLSSLDSDGKDNAYATFQIDSNYYIDFREGVQKNVNDPSKLTLVGRFEGDSKIINTLNYLDSILITKLES